MQRITKKIKDRYERTQVGGERKKAEAEPKKSFPEIPFQESKNNRLKKLIKIITSEKLQIIKEEKQIGYKKK